MKQVKKILALGLVLVFNYGYAQIGGGPVVVTSSNLMLIPFPPEKVTIDNNGNVIINITNRCPELIVNPNRVDIKVGNINWDRSKFIVQINEEDNSVTITISGLQNVSNNTNININFLFDNGYTYSVIPYNKNLVNKWQQSQVRTNSAKSEQLRKEKPTDTKPKMKKTGNGKPTTNNKQAMPNTNNAPAINPCEINTFSINFILVNSKVKASTTKNDSYE